MPKIRQWRVTVFVSRMVALDRSDCTAEYIRYSGENRRD
jgi:hypothetical protein